MMNNPPGVFPAVKKDGTVYYRASITYRSKHISLGSYTDKDAANEAYNTASVILGRTDGDAGPKSDTILTYDSSDTPLSFEKWVMLINLRDNGIYCRGPIYLRMRYFEYYLDQKTVLRFSADELFYYTYHKIQRRGGHFFVADYGSQINILNRYGIPSHAVKKRDYFFRNGDEYDFRAGNIVIINRYHGVLRETRRGRPYYTARIHVNGDMIVGRYEDETDAAIAYNKAADILNKNGVAITFGRNYIEDISEAEYHSKYENIRISKRIRNRHG